MIHDNHSHTTNQKDYIDLLNLPSENIFNAHINQHT